MSPGNKEIDKIQDEIIQEMSSREDWMGKYEYLIGLGKDLTVMDGKFRTAEHALPGCQSQVWIRSELKAGKVVFSVDSDSMIIRGILALLLRMLNQQPPAAIAKADLYFIEKTGLSTHLSPTRANGVKAIVKRLKSMGTSYTTVE